MIKWTLPQDPVLLAPLAGVSDAPFRRLCSQHGAHMTYVEMLSASAIYRENAKTFSMMSRLPEEETLGVQFTGSQEDECLRAVEVLQKQGFDTIDMNMGCPVKKVVQSGCGSAWLKRVDEVCLLLKKLVLHCDVPFSIKIRLGWTRQELVYLDVVKGAQEAGVSWVTIHGRCRSERYDTPVDLGAIRKVCEQVSLPVIGNGNIFSSEDRNLMLSVTGARGVMVSRGAMGDPWIFRRLMDGQDKGVSLEDWVRGVKQHLFDQKRIYGDTHGAALRMRGHLLWYLKGWPGSKECKLDLLKVESLQDQERVMENFAERVDRSGVLCRHLGAPGADYIWDPEF